MHTIKLQFLLAEVPFIQFERTLELPFVPTAGLAFYFPEPGAAGPSEGEIAFEADSVTYNVAERIFVVEHRVHDTFMMAEGPGSDAYVFQFARRLMAAGFTRCEAE